MNDDTITTTEMFELLRSDIRNQSSELKAQIADLKAEIAEVRSDMKNQSSELKAEIIEVRSELKAEISDVRSDIQSLDDRLRNVETAVAGTTAVATYKKTLLIDWLFRIAATIGVGGAIKAFLF